MSFEFHNHPDPLAGQNNPELDPTHFSDSEDYTPEVNVNTLHESVVREKIEQIEGKEPLSLYLTLFFAVLIFWAGAYLFRYSGGFDSNVYDGELIAYGPQKGGSGGAAVVDPIAVGKRLYTVNCSSCHQPTGQGTPNQYPPLAGSDIVLSKNGYGENHLARIMLGGLVGPINVCGSTVNGNMPAWSGLLKDDQIAYILTFIRGDKEWGNQAGAITPEEIATVRAEVAAHSNPWTDEEFKKLPAAPLAAPAAPAAATPAGSPGSAPTAAPAKK